VSTPSTPLFAGLLRIPEGMALLVTAFLTVGLAACGDDGANNTTDARSNSDAAAPVDSATDAMPRPDAPMCVSDLTPLDDGTGVTADLVISEIAVGNFIELYNTTNQPIALADTTHQLCSPFIYTALGTIAPDVIVAPGGFATVPFPTGFTDSDSRGEIMLYKDSSFDVNTSILDFICWGPARVGSSRKDQALAIGKWVGDCAPAINGGSIARTMSSTGTGAASYDANAIPSPTNCQ